MLSDGTNTPVSTDQIKTGNAHQGIDDTGQPWHVSKQKSNEIKLEKTDKAPVDRANDHKG